MFSQWINSPFFFDKAAQKSDKIQDLEIDYCKSFFQSFDEKVLTKELLCNELFLSRHIMHDLDLTKVFVKVFNLSKCYQL